MGERRHSPNASFGWKVDIDESAGSMLEGHMKPSRKKRLPPQSWPPVDPLVAAENHLREMERWLAYLKIDEELWELLTMHAVSAHAAIENAGDQAPVALRQLFEDVMESFRAETSNFQDVKFLQSTRSARRNNPRLFQRHR
jgi:hypothetical protein